MVEPADELGRRGLRCADAEPETRFVARHEFAHRRDVRQCIRARRGRYCASARSLPALIYSIDATVLTNVTCTCPPNKSVSAGPARKTRGGGSRIITTIDRKSTRLN